MRKTVLEATQRATQTQALKKITAGVELLPPAADNGVRYLLFQARALSQKPVAIAPSSATVPAPTEKKPFRDPFAKEHLEQDLFITQVHDTHNLVLNKFNVVDEHVRLNEDLYISGACLGSAGSLCDFVKYMDQLVLPTIEYEEQEMPLSKADLRAMWSVMRDLDAFAFFNCGYESGARCVI